MCQNHCLVYSSNVMAKEFQVFCKKPDVWIFSARCLVCAKHYRNLICEPQWHMFPWSVCLTDLSSSSVCAWRSAALGLKYSIACGSTMRIKPCTNTTTSCRTNGRSSNGTPSNSERVNLRPQTLRWSLKIFMASIYIVCENDYYLFYPGEDVIKNPT